MPHWLANVLQTLTDFSNVLNASIAASWLILAVLLMRPVLRRAPKWVFVALWGIVALRLLMPVSIQSVFSLVPSAETVSTQLLQAGPVPGANPAYLEIVTNPNFGNTVTMELDTSISSFQWDLLEWNLLWLAGMAVMGLYTLISYWRLRHRVREAVLLHGNIYQSELVHSPFVLGLFRPRIYLPYSHNNSIAHVIAHEQAHIRRKDHWWKPLGFFLLTVHWFNPLMWLAYCLLCRDIELACDEKVIKELGNDQRADYTQALVTFSVSRKGIAACPLAFGEVGVKERVKNVMNYKKPGFWVMVIAVVICIGVAVCFLTDPPTGTLKVLPEIHSHKFGVVDLLYDSPWYSFSVVPQENSPEYMVTEQMELMTRGEISGGQNWTNVGTLTEITLTKENFDKLFPSEDGWIRESPAYIRRNTARAWYVIYDQEHLYYLLQWKNGELYLAYGYYDYAEKDDPGSDDTSFRWLFCLTADADPEFGIYARSGEYSVPVTVFPANTPVKEYKNAIHWLTIDPGEDFCPFRVYLNGRELLGHFLCVDAKTYETAAHQIPSGLEPQTYLFQNCDPDREYIVVMMPSEEPDSPIYTFGVRFADEPAKPIDIEYDLTVGDEGVCRIVVKANGQEEVMYKQDGMPYRKGDRLRLNLLSGSTLEDGFQILSLDADGNQIRNIAHYGSQFGNFDREIAFGDWIITPIMNQQENPVLLARILEIRDGYFLVKPLEGSRETADRIEVPMKNMDPSTEPQVGDILEIEYDGLVQELYPLRIPNVFHISVADYTPEPMIPTDTHLSGLQAGALLVPMDGNTYRYELTEHDPEYATAARLLLSFDEEDIHDTVHNEVYALKEYPDLSAVLLLSDLHGASLWTYSPPRRCSGSALEDAISAGHVVIQDGIPTHGQPVWQEFYNSTQKGSPASVTVSGYYTLDPARCDSVYYGVFQQDYPNLSVHELTYTGDHYILRDSATGDRTLYQFLMRYKVLNWHAGSDAVTGPIVRYVLTNDDSVTWDDIWNGMISSSFGAHIDHFTVYTEYPDQILREENSDYAEAFAAWASGDQEPLMHCDPTAALRYCMEQFEQGVLEDLTFDSTGPEMCMYEFWQAQTRLLLENVVTDPQNDWRDWSEYVKRMYERNGYEYTVSQIFDDTMPCEQLYALMLAEREE